MFVSSGIVFDRSPTGRSKWGGKCLSNRERKILQSAVALINAAEREFDQLCVMIERNPVIEELREMPAVESGPNIVCLVQKD